MGKCLERKKVGIFLNEPKGNPQSCNMLLFPLKYPFQQDCQRWTQLLDFQQLKRKYLNKISKHLWQIFGGILAIKDNILDVLISSFLGSLSWISIENVLWKNYIRVSKKSYRIQKSPQGMESKFWTSFIVKLIRCLLEKSFMEQVGRRSAGHSHGISLFMNSYCALILIIIIITNLILILEYGCLSVHVSQKDSLSTG